MQMTAIESIVAAAELEAGVGVGAGISTIVVNGGGLLIDRGAVTTFLGTLEIVGRIVGGLVQDPSMRTLEDFYHRLVAMRTRFVAGTIGGPGPGVFIATIAGPERG
jgi:hypothetical protein